MKIKQLRLINLRSFAETHVVDFHPQINVFIGANNSGKSTVLQALLEAQHPNSLDVSDIRAEASSALISIDFDEANQFIRSRNLNTDRDVFTFDIGFHRDSSRSQSARVLKQGFDFTRFEASEPKNLFYPVLSNRKVSSYNEDIREQNARGIHLNLTHLAAKIDRVSNAFHERFDYFRQACESLLGFQMTALASPNGKKPGYMVNRNLNIFLEKMGQGTAQVLGVLCDLAVAEDKIFLVEEPENDVHPVALKGLLDLVIASSKSNQFLVSTHSHIVVSKLAAHGSLFHVEMSQGEKGKPPSSTCTFVGPSAGERMNVLRSLGYGFEDYELWAGWLILEESSAERVINELLIPWFVPNLKRSLRTVSSRSLGRVKSTFDDFSSMLLFLHLQPQYKNRAWVVVDGGHKELDVIKVLRTRYQPSGWHEQQFRQWTKHDFEDYFPARFSGAVAEAKVIQSPKARQDRKREILLDLLEAARQDSEGIRAEIEVSAAEVIALLREIKAAIQ